MTSKLSLLSVLAIEKLVFQSEWINMTVHHGT